MDFNKKYNGDKNAAFKDGLLISDKIGLCLCDKPTRYIDINHEGYVCSEECRYKLDTQTWNE